MGNSEIWLVTLQQSAIFHWKIQNNIDAYFSTLRFTIWYRRSLYFYVIFGLALILKVREFFLIILRIFLKYEAQDLNKYLVKYSSIFI